jgi:hypothetical protein
MGGKNAPGGFSKERECTALLINTSPNSAGDNQKIRFYGENADCDGEPEILAKIEMKKAARRRLSKSGW